MAQVSRIRACIIRHLSKMVVTAAQFGLLPVCLLQELPRAWDVQRTAEKKMETTIMGYIMENQMENKMENEMETGGIYYYFSSHQT